MRNQIYRTRAESKNPGFQSSPSVGSESSQARLNTRCPTRDGGPGHSIKGARTPGPHAIACEADEHDSSGQAGSDYTKTPDRSNITAFLTFASIWDTAQVQISSRRFDAMEGPGESPAPGTTVQAKQTLRRLNHDWVAPLLSRNPALLTP